MPPKELFVVGLDVFDKLFTFRTIRFRVVKICENGSSAIAMRRRGDFEFVEKCRKLCDETFIRRRQKAVALDFHIADIGVVEAVFLEIIFDFVEKSLCGFIVFSVENALNEVTVAYHDDVAVSDLHIKAPLQSI